ncbi:MAG TPA: FmdB family transcriptional regulator [Clostridiales bacterium]|nr:FmdB family transcriptional regulator [Clostridiales bacterium]
MPYYDLRCEKCQSEFNVKASIQERSEGKISCPTCGSQELATVYRKVNVLRYKGKDCDVCPVSVNDQSHGGCCNGNCRHGG